MTLIEGKKWTFVTMTAIKIGSFKHLRLIGYSKDLLIMEIWQKSIEIGTHSFSIKVKKTLTQHIWLENRQLFCNVVCDIETEAKILSLVKIDFFVSWTTLSHQMLQIWVLKIVQI